MGRERDREMADLRDKSEELSSRIETLEKERNLFINNVSLKFYWFMFFFIANAIRRHNS